MKGIDISKWNGAVDFNKVKSAGVEVVYIKATEGVDYIDPLLEQHYKGACGTGLAIGFYHFMSEKTNPSQQAQDFYNSIRNKEYNCLPVLDAETNKQGRNSKEYTDRIIEFLTEFKRLSEYDCILYACTSFIKSFYDDRLSHNFIWEANYGSNNGVIHAISSYPPLGTRVGHQYTDKGYCPGTESKYCDLNVFEKTILINNIKPVEPPKEVVSPGVITKEYEQHGKATILVNKLNVRTAPSLNAAVVATYTKGEVINNYDRVYEADGYRWIRYLGRSGNYRYVAVRVLATNVKYAHCE